MSNLFFFSGLQVVDANGNPISGAKLNFYATGTSTPKNTYSESTLTTANANPVVANSAGRFGPIYLLANGAYKVVLTDASDNVLQTIDPVDVRVASVVATQLAGTVTTTGLAASGQTLTVSINGLTAETSIDATADYVMVYDASAGALRKALVQYVQKLPKGYLYGGTLANGTDADHDIDVTAGVCRDATDAVDITIPAYTKQLDGTFAEGTAAGGFASGESLPTSGTVHVWAIRKADGTADIFANDHATSGLSPTLPTGYAYKRRLGSLRTDSSANIIAFEQDGDDFYLHTPILDVSAANPGTSAVTRTTSAPSGIRVKVHLNVLVEGASNSLCYLSDLALTDLAASQTAAPLSSTSTADSDGLGRGGPVSVWTNTSAAIRSRLSASAAAVTLYIATLGWRDLRA